MRWIASFVIATLLLVPSLTWAEDPPAIPSHLSVGMVGNPLAVLPKLQITFRNNADSPVGFALEVTVNGEVVAQPDVSLHVHCVANRPDWACELGWWQNPDWGQYVVPDNATHAFQWDDVQYDTEYCFRIRVFAPDDQATENWSKQTCKRIPPVPPVPMAPIGATDKFTVSEEHFTWFQRDSATVAAFTLETSDADADRWHPLDSPAFVNHGSDSQQASVRLSGIPSPFKALPDYRICASNVSGKTCSTAHRSPSTPATPPVVSTPPPAAPPGWVSDVHNEASAKARHDAIRASLPSDAVSKVDNQRPGSAAQAPTGTSKPPPIALGRVKEPPKALGRVGTGAPLDPTKTMCDYARDAKARNSPAAPGLERQCLAGGGSMTPPPPPPPPPPVVAPDLDALAAVGAAIAAQDPVVAQARSAEAGAYYQVGFDIASGLFGDPALGSAGNTVTGPGSESIRNSLSAAGQRGFNASVAFHQSRDYKH